MLLNRRVSILKKVLITTKMVNPRKVEESVNSDYDSTSTGSNESEVSIQLSAAKSTDSPNTKVVKEEKVKTLSKSLRKKFFRHFSNVDEEEEEVRNRFSCALLADILLQGHLYVTSNYFAFYSNVFGYVTRILIPILSVEKITKEKTAKILPNAIGIATAESKYVFGSLLSRDSTLDYFTKIWQKVKEEAPARMLEADLMEDDLDSNDLRANESEGDGEDERDGRDTPELKNKIQPEVSVKKSSDRMDIRTSSRKTKTVSYFTARFEKISHRSLLLIISTLLLILLYLTASVLLYRINQVQHRYSRILHDLSHLDSSTVYSDLLRWQTELYSKSDEAVYGFLDSNLVKIAKVRQSLETLSSFLAVEVDPSVEDPTMNVSGTAEGVS